MIIASSNRPSFIADVGMALRPLAPLILVPLGAIYCQVHELFFGETRSSAAESLAWAAATLLPWVIAAWLFERRAMQKEQRSRLLRLALALGASAYGASAVAALILGSGLEQAFYSRLPLLGVALLGAALYPLPGAVQGPEPTGDQNDPPVAAGEVLFASAAGNYIELHAGGRTVIWRQTMHNAERLLRPAGFVRVHRSYLVPRHSIDRVTLGRKGPVELVLRNGSKLPVSGRYAANLRH